MAQNDIDDMDKDSQIDANDFCFVFSLAVHTACKSTLVVAVAALSSHGNAETRTQHALGQ